MGNPNVDTEKGAALAAALEELFRQYPISLPDPSYLLRWRSSALRLAQLGRLEESIYWAQSTGVPHDVLTALEMLLE